MKAKESKEVVVAKLSIRQAVIVAVISLFSAVAVAFIANFDKLVGANPEVKEEVGYYEARAGNVERALREKEEELQAQSELARENGRLEEASQLTALADVVRAEDVTFRERHDRHLEAIKSGKRIVASEIKTAANEGINKINLVLSTGIYAPDPRWDRLVKTARENGYEVTVSKSPKGKTGWPVNNSIIIFHGHSFGGLNTIPLYGKGMVMQMQEEICEIEKTPNLEHKGVQPTSW